MSCRDYFIIPFLFGLIAIVATSSLAPEVRPDDLVLTEGSAAGTSENKPNSSTSISSGHLSVPSGSPTPQMPTEGCGTTECRQRLRIERKEFFCEDVPLKCSIMHSFHKNRRG